MVRDLSTSKIMALGRSLTGKEAALLIIDYEIREKDTGKSYKSEIDALVSSVKYAKDPKQTNECIFYHELWKNVGFYCLDLQTCLMDIEINTWKLTSFQMLITECAIKHELNKAVNKLPGFLTIEDFEAKYEECKKDRFEEILPLETIVEHEAFQKLKVDGLIDSNSIYGIDDVFSDNKDLEAKWFGYLDQLLAKYEDDIKCGILIEGKVTEKGGWYHSGEKYIDQRGITGESWYRYSKKLDEGFNKSIDDKEKLVDFYNGTFAIAKGSSAYKREGAQQCAGETARQFIKDVLQHGQCLSEKSGVITLDVDVKTGMEIIISRMNKRIVEVKNYQEVIKRLQSHIYGDIIQLGDFTTAKIESILDNATCPITETKKQLLRLFMPFSFSKEPKLLGFENLDVKIDPLPEEKVVEEHYNWLLDLAEKESGYRWRG